MAGHGGGRVLGQYAAGAEGRRRDLSGVLRIARPAVFAGGSEDNSRLHRRSIRDGQETGNDQALRRDHRARTRRGRASESMLQRSSALGTEEDRERNFSPPRPGSSLGLEGDQGIYRKRWRRPSSRSGAGDPLRRL